VLPPFDANGLLPPGDYDLSFQQLRASHLVVRPSPDPKYADWDEGWRSHLVDSLEILTKQLWRAGASEVFAAGSFVEDKDHPNDIDGYFLVDIFRFASGDFQRDLNLMDPNKVWTWDPTARRPLKGHPKRELPMWHQYRIDLYPHYGQHSGIFDCVGHPLCFPDAFRISKGKNIPRGIIRLRRQP
jgi:hypothetical protein